MLRRRPLRWQLLALQLLIVLITVAGTGFVAVRMHLAQIRDAYEQQMIGVANSVAGLPSVVEAFDDPNPSETIQPIAELIREASGLAYVVVTDDEGIRFSHPVPERIGERVSTDPSIPLNGEVFVGTQTGTLGESWRVKVPVRAADGTIIGTASVGKLESDLRSDLLDDLPWLVAWLVAASVVGTIGAYWVSRLVWRRIYRLEPEEIAGLLETRDAMLHGIKEGIVALHADGRVALVNDEARRLLAQSTDVTGERAVDVLDPSVLALLDSGSLDGELVLSGERVLVAQRHDAEVDGQIVGTVLLLRDQTELRQVVRDLDGARDISQALRAQAHEHSNVLHVISGLIELGRSDEAVDFIERTGRTSTGTSIELPATVTDPELIALLTAKSATARERGIDVVVDQSSVYGFDGTSDVVTSLGNLIDNAVDAIGSMGRVAVSIEQAHDGSVVLEVCDDGPGIARKDRERVFSPGVSTKDPGQVGTRGIGLALVARIANRRGGSAEVMQASTPGATLRVTLGPPVRTPSDDLAARS